MKRAFLLFAPYALVVGHLLWSWNDLRDPVATRFDMAGNAVDTMSRDAFVLTMTAVATFLLGTFAGTLWLIPKMPASLINLPHKDYWLHPTRRDATFEAIQNTMTLFLLVTMALLLVIDVEIVRNNLGTSEARLSPWLVLGTYLAVITVVTVRFVLRFRRPAVTDPD
ncbi:MAG: hypothetical protein KDC95_00970 [Planctomycetes bacterium]|nr:hypothetical protein [Planctomycetota bacterium]